MSLTELLTEIKSLPRADKACLIKTLLDEMTQENNALTEENIRLQKANAGWELRQSPEAAYALQQLFQEELAKNRLAKG